MKNEDIIKKARDRFDHTLHTENYKIIHSDSGHLKNLIDLMEIKNGKAYLDLGTGNGYIAFDLAGKYKDITVTGLDIAENSIVKNLEIKKEKNIPNIDFQTYNGDQFPFKNKYFYGCVSRYAFHHFPDPDKMIKEISRILEDGGFFLLSDPLTYDEDRKGFIDRFQKLQGDGHVHFYYRKEIEKYFTRHRFHVEDEFYSEIRYPREFSMKYAELFIETGKKITDLYEIEQVEGRVYVKVKVMNILFRKP